MKKVCVRKVFFKCKGVYKYWGAALVLAFLVCLHCQPAFAAITESDVQAQVDSAGKDAVAGNVLIWFLCAVSFLKISQKIDSFMASLGVNVGHTGGSMLAEAMIATKGLSTVRNASSRHFGGGRTSSAHSASGGGSKSGVAGVMGGFMSGGLAGVVSRSIQNGAARAATESFGKTSGAVDGSGRTGGVSGGIGSQIYTSSVSKGGNFANNVISSIATGSIASTGSITGEKAEQALQSYMGYAALEEGADFVPSFSNVEMGGGRITGTEVSEEHPNGTAFGMYHTAQYTAPSGNYTTVQTADGASWYKQNAAEVVDKSPYMAPDGSIAYKESIVKKLPPPPQRKDRI